MDIASRQLSVCSGARLVDSLHERQLDLVKPDESTLRELTMRQFAEM